MSQRNSTLRGWSSLLSTREVSWVKPLLLAQASFSRATFKGGRQRPSDARGVREGRNQRSRRSIHLRLSQSCFMALCRLLREASAQQALQ